MSGRLESSKSTLCWSPMVKVTVPPTRMVTVGGVKVRLTSFVPTLAVVGVAPVTVNVTASLFPSDVAVTVAVPAVAAVTVTAPPVVVLSDTAPAWAPPTDQAIVRPVSVPPFASVVVAVSDRVWPTGSAASSPGVMVSVATDAGGVPPSPPQESPAPPSASATTAAMTAERDLCMLPASTFMKFTLPAMEIITARASPRSAVDLTSSCAPGQLMRGQGRPDAPESVTSVAHAAPLTGAAGEARLRPMFACSRHHHAHHRHGPTGRGAVRVLG